MDGLARAAREAPDAAAIITAERTIDYAELDRAAWGVADFIVSSGTLAGHPVAFWGERTPEAVAAAWGIPRAGVTAVPIDPRRQPAHAMEATRFVGVRGLWTSPAGGLDRLADRVDRHPHETSRGGYVIFTSGSEGQPRGVRITQENITASVVASAARLGHGADDAWLCVLPLFHVGGLSILWRQADSGAPVVLHESFDAGAVAAALTGVAFASLVPVMLRRVLAEIDLLAGETLRAALIGGAAADQALLSAARAKGIAAVPTYGMTETTSQIATPRPSDPLDGTVGVALDGAEIRVVEDGRPVLDAPGRIEVRGPMVSPGYVGEIDRPPDQWHTTGDVGSLDGLGRLTVLGRADAVIVTGGEKVHPAAVEGALRAHPGIREIRVLGVPDDEWGAVVTATVETDLSSSELDEVAGTLPPAMRPRRWEIVERVAGKLDD
jgi:O-succinylbenzoic acid--CoA ligase